jgi:hypothetical protein
MTYDEAFSAWLKATDELKDRIQALESLDVIKKITKESVDGWHDECIRLYKLVVELKKESL